MKRQNKQTYNQLKHIVQTKPTKKEQEQGQINDAREPSRHDHSQSEEDEPPFTTNTRIILEELVLVTNFLTDMLNPEITARSCYFGKYGKVTKTIFTQKNFQKKISHLAFITYQNHLDAALAIAALEPFSHNYFKCTTTYGTVKYCPSFLSGVKCTFKQCYFMHQVQKNSITVEEIRELSHTERIKPAMNKIKKNLTYYIEKQHQEFLASKNNQKQTGLIMCNCECENKGEVITFPSVRETMARLVKQGKIDKVQYDRLKNQYKERIVRERNQKLLAQKKVKIEEFDSLLTPEKSECSKRSEVSLSETQDKSDDERFPSLVKTLTLESAPLPTKVIPPVPTKVVPQVANKVIPQVANKVIPPAPAPVKKRIPEYKPRRQQQREEKPHQLRTIFRPRPKSRTVLQPQPQNQNNPFPNIFSITPEPRQFYFKSPPSATKTLSQYQKLLPPQKALSCYIHQKILHQANYYQPALLILSPERYNHQQSNKYKSNLMRHLLEY